MSHSNASAQRQHVDPDNLAVQSPELPANTQQVQVRHDQSFSTTNRCADVHAHMLNT